MNSNALASTGWRRRLMGSFVVLALSSAAPALATQTADEESDRILTNDHRVAHVSTVPANAGAPIELFLRERVARNKAPDKVVLMIHGLSIPVLPGFQLKHEHYDWSEELAKAGFDVFMLDFQGSGLSPRPKMDDPCNLSSADQALLIGNPLSAPCKPNYAFQLVNAASDADELDTVVDYIRSYRGVEKVALVSWSHGAVRAGRYAVQHPEKVDRLFFLAPFFDPSMPAGRPGVPVPDGFSAPYKALANGTAAPCSATELAQGQCPGVAAADLRVPGVPMTLRNRAVAIGQRWEPEIKCDDQVEEGIKDLAWKAIMDNDDVGRTWGLPAAAPEGVMRVRSFVLWGWNTQTAARIQSPVLIIGGEFDSQVPPSGLPQLYGAIGDGVPKLLFKVACASHHMVWERQSKLLHHISKQWLKHGTVEGFDTGQFYVDTDGNLYPM